MKRRTLEKFLGLPIEEGEIWQGGVVPFDQILSLPPTGSAEGALMALWLSVEEQLVHGKPILPTPEETFDEFVDVMLEMYRKHKFPFRPEQIQCND